MLLIFNKGTSSGQKHFTQPSRVVVDDAYINSAVKDPKTFRVRQLVGEEGISTSSGHSTTTKALSVAAACDAQLQAYPTTDVLTPASRRRRNQSQTRTQYSQPNQPQLLFSELIKESLTIKQLFEELSSESFLIPFLVFSLHLPSSRFTNSSSYALKLPAPVDQLQLHSAAVPVPSSYQLL